MNMNIFAFIQKFLTALPLITALLCLTALTAFSQTGEPLREPILRIETGMHTALIKSIGADAAGTFLVTASEDKTARIWDIATGELLRVLRPPLGAGNEGKLYSAAISADGSTVAVGGWAGYEWDTTHSIYLFDRSSGRLVRRLSGLPNVVLHLVFSPDGKYLAAMVAAGDARVYETGGWQQIGAQSDSGNKCYRADFDRSGRLVMSCSDGFIKLYAIGQNGLRQVAKTNASGGKQPLVVKFSPDGDKIAVVVDSKSVSVLSASDLSLLFAPDTSGMNNGGFSSLAWSATGDILYAGGGYRTSGTIRSWTNGGRGAYRETNASSLSMVGDIQPLPNGGVIYETLDPAWGIIDASGKRTRYIVSSIADYRGLWENFRVSFNGAEIGFGYEVFGKSAALFALLERRLALTANQTLSSPRTTANNLNITDWRSDDNISFFEPKLNGHKLMAQPEQSCSLALAPDDSKFLLGTVFRIRLFDRTGAELWNVPVPSFAWSVNISGDGRLAIAAFGDGTIRWYRMRDGKELLAFFPHADRKRWVAWTPEGYYDASPGAEDLIGWHVNNGKDQAADFYPIGQFFEKFYHPKLLAQVLTPQGVQPPTPGAVNTVSITKELKRPPLVRITSPKPGPASNSDTAQIVVVANDQGGGVEDIRLFQNGKLVSDDTRQLTQVTAAKSRTFEVTLLPGVNTFRATAFNTDRTEATPDEIKIELKAVEASSNLYILAIGLNEYKNTRYNLNYGRADAQAFADAVEQHGKGIFKQITKKVVFDAGATRSGIQAAFDEIIKQAKPQDAFVFFYAGHGVMSEGDDKNAADFFLVPYDVVRIFGDDGSLANNGIGARNLREMLTKVRAQKQLIVLDACQSGGAVETIAMRGAAEEKAIMQLARSAGVAVLASAGQDQTATEFAKLGHGVFTYALLKGLNGDADGSPMDGKITVKELEAYINDQVPELTKLYRGKRQDPNSSTRGQDFPIAIKQ